MVKGFTLLCQDNLPQTAGLSTEGRPGSTRFSTLSSSHPEKGNLSTPLNAEFCLKGKVARGCPPFPWGFVQTVRHIRFPLDLPP